MFYQLIYLLMHLTLSNSKQPFGACILFLKRWKFAWPIHGETEKHMNTIQYMKLRTTERVALLYY